MSDDTRAPRQPLDDGSQPEAGSEAGEPRELPDIQDQLEAALARSRGIGEDGDVHSGEVHAGDDLAFDGRAEAPTDPALAPQDDVTVAFADPLAADAGDGADGADPNATVGLDRDELAAVLAQGTSSHAEVTPNDAGHPDAEPADSAQTHGNEATEAATQPEPAADPIAAQPDVDSDFDEVPVADRVIAEEDDVADFPVTEPVPAQDLAADAIGAESVAAITVDAAGSATAPDDERDAPRRTLEIDRTAARVAAVGSSAPAAATADPALPSEPEAAPTREDDVEVAKAEAVVTETVTEHLAADGERVDAVTVTERVDVLDDDGVRTGVVEATAAEEPGATQTPAEAAGSIGAPVLVPERDTESQAPLSEAAQGEDADEKAGAGSTATSADDDSTFAPLRLSVPTDNDDLAPVKPKKRGNRMFAVFVALVASVVFAALYLLAFALLRTAFNTGLDPIGEASEFAITAAFTVPVTVFAAFGVIWALIVNRAGWWAYVLGGFLAAALVVVGYYFGAALQQHLADGLPLTSIQLDEVLAKFRASEHLLTALVAAIAAREAFTWVGGIAAARGHRVSRANRRAKLSYEKRMAERAAETAEANGAAE